MALFDCSIYNNLFIKSKIVVSLLTPLVEEERIPARATKVPMEIAVCTLPIVIPNEVSVIGYDDIDFAMSATVPLTSISQPAYELGYAAAELIISECENPERHVHQRIEFQPRLIVRSSTGPANSN